MAASREDEGREVSRCRPCSVGVVVKPLGTSLGGPPEHPVLAGGVLKAGEGSGETGLLIGPSDRRRSASTGAPVLARPTLVSRHPHGSPCCLLRVALVGVGILLPRRWGAAFRWAHCRMGGRRRLGLAPACARVDWDRWRRRSRS
jgi:hypothetical protein